MAIVYCTEGRDFHEKAKYLSLQVSIRKRFIYNLLKSFTSILPLFKGWRVDIFAILWTGLV